MPFSRILGRRFGLQTLWMRTSFLLILVISSVLLIISFLNYSNYRKNFYEQNSSRYMVLAKDLRQTIEAGLNIGLSASANTRLRNAMQEAMQQMNGIRFIAILDEGAGLLYEGQIEPGQERQWRMRVSQNELTWQQSHPEFLELGMSFSNNFNLRIGAVLIGYQRAPIEQAMADMRRKLLIDTLQTLALAVLLTLAGVYLLTRKLQRDLHAVAGHLDAILDAPQVAQLPPGVLDQQAAEEIDQFAHLSHRVLQNMRQAEDSAAPQT